MKKTLLPKYQQGVHRKAANESQSCPMRMPTKTQSPTPANTVGAGSILLTTAGQYHQIQDYRETGAISLFQLHYTNVDCDETSRKCTTNNAATKPSGSRLLRRRLPKQSASTSNKRNECIYEPVRPASNCMNSAPPSIRIALGQTRTRSDSCVIVWAYRCTDVHSWTESHHSELRCWYEQIMADKNKKHPNWCCCKK